MTSKNTRDSRKDLVERVIGIRSDEAHAANLQRRSRVIDAAKVPAKSDIRPIIISAAGELSRKAHQPCVHPQQRITKTHLVLQLFLDGRTLREPHFVEVGALTEGIKPHDRADDDAPNAVDDERPIKRFEARCEGFALGDGKKGDDE